MIMQSVQQSAERGRARLPDWAADLSVALESGACGQFVLYGNVHDRFAIGERFVGIDRFIEDEMLGTTDVILSYDLGNGLIVERGEKRLAQWAPPVMRALPQQPLDAVRFIGRYMRYLGNLQAVGNGDIPRVAVIMRGIDQLLPADGRGFEHESLTYLVRDWALGSPFVHLPFASLLTADNLTDVEPLIVFSPQVKLVRIPLPSVNELQGALRLLQQEHPETVPRATDVAALAAAVSGVSVNTLQQITKLRAHNGRRLQAEDFAALKKEMVERDAPGQHALAPQRRARAAHGLPALWADRHGQDIPRRVPRRRGRCPGA